MASLPIWLEHHSEILLVLIIVGNSLIGLPAAWLFRKYGFLAAVGMHFWTDIVWHVLRGAI